MNPVQIFLGHMIRKAKQKGYQLDFGPNRSLGIIYNIARPGVRVGEVPDCFPVDISSLPCDPLWTLGERDTIGRLQIINTPYSTTLFYEGQRVPPAKPDEIIRYGVRFTLDPDSRHVSFEILSGAPELDYVYRGRTIKALTEGDDHIITPWEHPELPEALALYRDLHVAVE